MELVTVGTENGQKIFSQAFRYKPCKKASFKIKKEAVENSVMGLAREFRQRDKEQASSDYYAAKKAERIARAKARG